MTVGPFKKILLSLLVLLVVVLIGVVGFMNIMGLDFIKALYATVVTMTTTGFGDVVPNNDFGRLFVVFLLVGGVGVVAYASTSLISIVVEGELRHFLGRRGMEKEIQKLQHHIIVCGAGRVGENVIHRLRVDKVPLVAIEQDEDICRRLRGKNILILCENATKDDVLMQAGIERASGLVSALSSDSDNVYVTLTAKSINPAIKVVSRMERPESENKLIRAGADKVISPAVLGGFRMANAILKPATVEFVETVLHRTNMEILLEEVTVHPSSPLVDKVIRTSVVRGVAGVTIVGIIRGNELIVSPGGDEVIRANDILIVIGRPDKFPLLEELTSPPGSAILESRAN
ncbi:MAG: potassium channel protein [Firmicutes bacterium]|nr:potassium channel protein [Bacillota bacterium]